MLSTPRVRNFFQKVTINADTGLNFNVLITFIHGYDIRRAGLGEQ